MARPTGELRRIKRYNCKASIAIEGLSGSGKTGAALLIAWALAGKDWNQVGILDTEQRSASLYSDTVFNNGLKLPEGSVAVAELTDSDGYRPSYYKYWQQKMIDAGLGAFIMDSGTHMWSYKDGILELVNRVQQTTTNKYAAWGNEEVTKEKAILMALVRSSEIHTITTIRAKEKQEVVYDKAEETNKVQSLGVQQIMMPDFKYEPDLVIRMLYPGNEETGEPGKFLVLKSRYRILNVNEEYDLTDKLLDQLKEYLEEGADPEELRRQQHEDYVNAVIEFLEANPSKQTVWPVIKEQFGVADTELHELPLHIIKQLFAAVTA